MRSNDFQYITMYPDSKPRKKRPHTPYCPEYHEPCFDNDSYDHDKCCRKDDHHCWPKLCCPPCPQWYPYPPCYPWPPCPKDDDHKEDYKPEPPKPPYIPQKLSAIQAQLIDSGGTTVANNSNVIFNTVLNREGTNISYDVATGEFTLAANKLYYVSWQVATDVENTITNIAFGLSVDGLLGPETSSPSLVGQISGTALIETDESSQTLALVNRSGGTVTYASNTVQANIVIHELNRYTTVHPF